MQRKRVYFVPKEDYPSGTLARNLGVVVSAIGYRMNCGASIGPTVAIQDQDNNVRKVQILDASIQGREEEVNFGHNDFLNGNNQKESERGVARLALIANKYGFNIEGFEDGS